MTAPADGIIRLNPALTIIAEAFGVTPERATFEFGGALVDIETESSLTVKAVLEAVLVEGFGLERDQAEEISLTGDGPTFAITAFLMVAVPGLNALTAD